MGRDFEDEDTQEFVRIDDANDELALEGVETWFWSDAENDGAAASIDAIAA
jgi:hypothetical protein